MLTLSSNNFLYKIHQYESREWIKDNLLHRKNDLPAFEKTNGSRFWYQNGQLHRENDLPAIETLLGENEWYLFNERYIIQENGTKEFIDDYGKLHRSKNLPAIEYSNGDKEWWVKGRRHRENGPAVIIGDKQFWFEDGKFKH